MSTKKTGDAGEARAVDHLKKHGYKIIDRNWRNKWCEIDIVARKADIIYFVEVKYRLSEQWGDGFDAIGHQKLERMSRAAEAWVAHNRWTGGYELAAVSVNDQELELRFIN